MIASATLFGICGAVVVGVGLYGFILQTHLLRRVVAFNVIGSGVFLILGAGGFREPLAGADPLPQALIITGIVVALSATALAVSLMVAYARSTGSPRLPEDAPPEGAPAAEE